MKTRALRLRFGLAGRLRRPFVVLAAMIVGGGIGVAAISSASAGSLPSNCVLSSGVVTCTFVYNGTDGSDGSAQSFAVPAQVTHVTVEAWGAQGGVNGGGGLGGHVKGTVPVTPTETLTVRVGGAPLPENATSGGFNGGGSGVNGSGASGGGGASDVRQGGDGLNNRILVAGGGGGEGATNERPVTLAGGAGGGPTGGQGDPASCGTDLDLCGGGGTATQGGAGGPSSCLVGSATTVDGGSGSAGTGGDGGSALCTLDTGTTGAAGGGGGGGLFGGGGGGAVVIGAVFVGASGGGGSGFVTPSATAPTNEAGIHVGNGMVTISYTAPIIITSHPPNIFAVTLKSCANLHVGYNYFPAGIVVHWRVNQTGTGTLASGSYTTLGGGRTYHFLTMPLGVTLKPDSVSSHTHVRFSWTIGSTTTNYEVTRDPGC